MTKFSFEVPISHLNDFEDLQDFHFSLSFLYANEEYKKFMCQQAKKGLKTLWLDNSYNEKLKADDIESLIALAKEINCTKVIAPDDPKWSTAKILNSVLQVAKEIPTHQIIMVVSSEEMLEEGKILGIETFAHSYWNRLNLKTYLYGTSYEDVRWAEECHFLGLISIDELVAMNPLSCDTSMPIKLALLGMNLPDWERSGWKHIYTHETPNFFDTRMSDDQIALARSNIIVLKNIVNGERNEDI